MKIQSSTHIQTDDGARIVKRLCNHWKHKFEITEQNQKFHIPFPEADVILEATSTEILALIRTEKAELLDQYENVVINHLNRMAHAEFLANWQRASV